MYKFSYTSVFLFLKLLSHLNFPLKNREKPILIYDKERLPSQMLGTSPTITVSAIQTLVETLTSIV